MSCAYFITASNYNTRADEILPDTFLMLDFSLALISLLSHIPQTYFDVKQWKYKRLSFSLLNYLSVIGPIIVFVSNRLESDVFRQTYMRAGHLAYTYPVRFICLQRAIEFCLSPKESSFLILSKMKRKILSLTNIIITTMFTVSSLLQVILNIIFISNPNIPESRGEIGGQAFLSFFDAFFFTSVSITNGPESKMVPDSTASRVAVLLTLLAAIIYIPFGFTQLLKLSQERPEYLTHFKPFPNHKYIILIGRFQLGCTFEFLKEFISDEFESQSTNTHIVILNPTPPDPDLENLLSRPEYKDRVTYVIGSGDSFRSLNRIHAENAAAFFIFTSFTDSHLMDDPQNDAFELFSNLERYMADRDMANRSDSSSEPRRVRAFLRLETPKYLINSEAFDKLISTGHFDTSYTNIDKYRMAFISHNCFVPGFSTLIHMLVSSISQERKNRLKSLLPDSRDRSIWWDHGYIDSFCHQIYEIEIPESWQDNEFSLVACSIYKEFQAILLGVGTKTKNKDGPASYSRIFLNPSHDKIDKASTNVAFVLTVSEEKAKKIEQTSLPDISRCDTLPPIHVVSSSNSSEEIQMISISVMTDDAEPQSSTSAQDPYHSSSPPIHQSILRDHESGESASSTSHYNVTTESDPDDAIPKFDNHILVCHGGTAFPNASDRFVKFIRARNFHKTIVFFGLFFPSDHDKELLLDPQVHLVQRSPQRHANLLNVHIEKAFKVIILSSSNARTTQAICSAIRALDIVNGSNIWDKVNFDFYSDEKLEYELENRAFSSSHLEVLDVLRRKVMTGRRFSLTMLDNLLCQTYFRPHVIKVVEKLLFNWDDNLEKLPQPQIDILKLPKHLKGKPFIHLFNLLLKEQSSLALGLYRKCSKQKFRYVLGFPDPRTILEADDYVYILKKS